METLNRRLLALRERLGLKQSAFAEVIGLGQSRYNKMESGTSIPAGDALIAIADHYPTVNMNWLLTGQGSIFTDGKVLVPADPAPPAVKGTMLPTSDLTEKERTDYWKGVAEQALKELARAEEREKWYQEVIGKKPEGNQHAAEQPLMFVSHKKVA